MEQEQVVITPWTHRPDTLRIAFSGSAGTGKTTLMHAVNEHLNLPVVSEGVRTYMKENKIEDVHTLEGQKLMKFQMDILARKKSIETKPEFISDRTTMDCLTYALYYLSDKEEFQRGLMDYTSECTEHAVRTYDIVFSLPYGRFDIEDDGVRKTMPAHQLAIQLMIDQALLMGNEFYYLHHVDALSVEDRVKEVLACIDKVKEVKAAIEKELRVEVSNID